MDRQTGGVVLAFAGFVFIVGAFKGTWRQTIDALLGGASNGGASSSSSGSGSPASRPAGSGLPGTSTVPGGDGNPLARAGGRRT